MRSLLALPLALLLVHPAAASVARVPVAVVPTGPLVGALAVQARALLASPMALPQSFQAVLLPSPAVATPEAFAARAALVQALASPKAALPALAAAVRESDSKHSEKAAQALEKLGAAIRQAPAAERRDMAKQAAALRARFDGASAAPGEAVDWQALPSLDHPRSEKAETKAMEKDHHELRKLQDILAASKERSVLVILQGMDTSGKDGVIKRPLSLNVAWTKVASFKKPTAEEASHDFLWRIKKQLPEKGIVGIFNRSHYEDIVVPTVYKTFSKEEVEKRYARIAAFEKKLTLQGVVIVKIFLNVSKAEQKARLEDRLADPDKRWKFSVADLESRKKWEAFRSAYAEVIARTSTPWAPWFVVAADDKPARDAKVAKILRRVMEGMGLKYPEAPNLDGVIIPD